MPPVSITIVCPAPMIASGAANISTFEAHSGVTVPGRTSSTPSDENGEQQDQRVNRAGAQEFERRPHLRSCKYANKPATITTSTISVPWMTWP